MTPATAIRSKHRGTRPHPHLSIGSKDLTASRMIYEPLAPFDKDGTLIPFLAAEIPSQKNGGVAPDGRSVTWTLKKGVTWADGAPPAQQAR
jgi:peptide/nickel transport system substrate-binding protein